MHADHLHRERPPLTWADRNTIRSDHKRMRREEVYRNDNFPIGRASRWRTAALPPCGIDGLRSLWACRIRRKVAHPIKRTHRQQGLTVHQQQRRWCQRHLSDRRSSWLISMLKCDGPVWTESGEIRTEAIARRLYTVGTPRTAFDQCSVMPTMHSSCIIPSAVEYSRSRHYIAPASISFSSPVSILSTKPRTGTSLSIQG
jgi:hypothetical protein